jgi:hypothetical protein
VEINLIFTPKTFSKRYAPNATRLIANIGMMIYIDLRGNFSNAKDGSIFD